MKRIQMTAVMLVLLLLGWIADSRASTILFTDQSAWEAEVVNGGYGLTTIDFTNTVSQNFYTVMAGDVIFSSDGVPLEVADYGIPYGSGKVLYPTHNQPIKIDLPDSVYAFGCDLGDLGGLIPPLYSPPTLSDIVLSTGEIFAGPYQGNPFPTFAFFGFLSDSAITSLSLWPHGSIEAIIDNFSYAQAASPAPEPASLVLLISGLVGLVGQRRWNRRGQGGR